MAKAKVIKNNIALELYDIIRFQINLYCFLNNYRLSPAQNECLALLGQYQPINISDFCDQTVEQNIFSSAQTTRNFIMKSIKDGLIYRHGTGNKLISLSEKLNLITEGTVLLDLKVYHHEGSN
jgi:hypothetical protein